MLEAYVGEPGSPQRVPAVKDETRRSGRTEHEVMKKVKNSKITKNKVQTQTRKCS